MDLTYDRVGEACGLARNPHSAGRLQENNWDSGPDDPNSKVCRWGCRDACHTNGHKAI
ncbi:hypothetical protein PC120_g25987 [Phytophthora cactorum]|nr:hypothetical protein PC120_g25987 [Phytophthora cactorum]